VSRVSWKQAARSANEAARFLAERLHVVSKQRDAVMENRNVIAGENTDLILRLTRTTAGLNAIVEQCHPGSDAAILARRALESPSRRVAS
jgi:hypothetical protein